LVLTSSGDAAMTDTLILEPTHAAQARVVRAPLFFFDGANGKPAVTYRDGSNVAETEAIYRERDVFIRDARGDHATLDRQGFELVTHWSRVRDFGDEEEVLLLGRAEAAELVRQATGAARVFVFDHTRRQRKPDAYRQPSTRVHVDYTAHSGPQRVRDFFGDEAEALLRKRVAFINVWRPLRWPAEDSPLALADARSVEPEDLVATDIVYSDRRGEIYAATYNPAQRWSYYPNMQLDEALLIKCYDSDIGVARFTPHTSFADPNTPADAPPRQSIEFRTMAFFD
jgi:hypothetical protein